MYKKSFFLRVSSIILMIFLILSHKCTLITYAHSFSASYSTLDLYKTKTMLTYALDEVSVMELTGGDVNKNGMLDKDEYEAIKGKIQSLLKDNLILKVDGQLQQWSKIDSMILNRKGDATQLILNVEYPPIQASQSISYLDTLYQNTETSATYVDLLKVNYGKQNSSSALSDTNRSWSMIISESEFEGLYSNEDAALPVKNNEKAIQPTHNQTSANKSTSTGSKDWLSFVKLGMNHILTGYDHLLFLLSLLIARQTFKQFTKVITAFTIAHSITLTLTVLGIISVPSFIVEPAIAVSICYVAIENIFRKTISHRWVLTFIFGLIHGMGFADLLTAMNLPKSSLAIDLASFNIGIEIIQLIIVILLLPALNLLHRWKHSKYAIISISTIAFLLGSFWLMERILFS